MIKSQNNLYHLIRKTRRILDRGIRSARYWFAQQLGLQSDDYELWLKQQSKETDLAKLEVQINNLKTCHEFILVFVVSPGEETRARTTLKSILTQIYTSWWTVLIQTGAWKQSFHEEILELQADGRHLSIIKLPVNILEDGKVNKVLDELPGEWVAHIRSGDILSSEALAEIVFFLDKFPDTGLVYSDEDSVNLQGKRYSPHFKPDWSPDLLLGHNYIGQLTVYKKNLLFEAGGLSGKISPEEDYDLLLHLTEKDTRIGHIPKILYSRGTPARPKDIEIEAEHLALVRAFQRRGKPTNVEAIAGFPGYFRVHWLLSEKPLVSIIICTKDRADLLEKCLISIYERTDYENFEVILIDNQSREKKIFELVNRWNEKEPSRFRCLTINEPFNFSTLNNHAAGFANGELLLFLNNDTEVISSDWLQEMAGQALRPETGTVGAMLLFKDGSIQHAGIIVGGKNLAVHAHRGISGNDPGYKGRLLSPSNVSAVTAACMMVRKEVFFQAGGFDEHLPHGYNDVALCLQLRRMGYFHILLPQVKLFHHESQTRGYHLPAIEQDQLQKEKEYLRNLYPELNNPDPFHNSFMGLMKENIH